MIRIGAPGLLRREDVEGLDRQIAVGDVPRPRQRCAGLRAPGQPAVEIVDILGDSRPVVVLRVERRPIVAPIDRLSAHAALLNPAGTECTRLAAGPSTAAEGRTTLGTRRVERLERVHAAYNPHRDRRRGHRSDRRLPMDRAFVRTGRGHRRPLPTRRPHRTDGHRGEASTTAICWSTSAMPTARTYLPDGTAHHGAGSGRTRRPQRRGSAALHHGRPGARYCGGACRVCAGVPPPPGRPHRQR